MSRKLMLLAALLFLTGDVLSASARDISVVSWNLQWFPGKSPFARAPARSNHLAEAKADLQRLNPDVFVAQEISNVQAFHDLVSVLTGYTVHVVSNFPRPGGGRSQQVAIASRFPARSAWAAAWQQTTNRPPRGYAFAALDVGDELVMVYSLHLKSNRVDPDTTAAMCIAKREDAIRQLLDHATKTAKDLAPDGNVGCIVAGDFNTNIDNPELAGERTLQMMEEAGFANAWHGGAQPDRLTWTGSKDFPPCTFDYVFARGVTIKKIELLDMKDKVSDHRPVLGLIHVPSPDPLLKNKPAVNPTIGLALPVSR
jgi:endonuclease/exonuclease/phosphatase family metal-dependent hydrolase